MVSNRPEKVWVFSQINHFRYISGLKSPFLTTSGLLPVHFRSKIAISGHFRFISGLKSQFLTTSGLLPVHFRSEEVNSGHFRFWPQAISGRPRQIWGQWATLVFCHTPEKWFLLWVLGPQSWAASNSLRGRGGQRSMAYNHRTLG